MRNRIKAEKIKQMIVTAGMFVWLGIIGPQLLLQQELGCLERKDGQEMTREETRIVLESLLQLDELTTMPEVEYKSKILEWLKGE